MVKIYEYTNKQGEKAQYRFTNNICDGFFLDNKLMYEEKGYKGKKLTEQWNEGLSNAGFVVIKL